MTRARHPTSGAEYELEPSGLVLVTLGEESGRFHPDGRWHSGKLRSADPHMTGWMGSRIRPGRKASQGTAPRKTEGRRTTAAEQGKYDMNLELEGKKALITAASRGIGLAIARELADQGADVAICARGSEALGVARKDLEARGATVFAKSVDVADGDALKAFVAEAGAELGGLDIVVCNASAGAGMGDEAWQANFDVDLMGTARAIEAAVPLLKKSDAGSIVVISSTAALEFLGIPQPYNAMKASLITHACDMAQALAPRGIRVNAVSPGPIFFEGGNWEMIKEAMPDLYEGTLAQCPMGRMGKPEEVARTVVFLASPAASLVTGANLVVDGGFTKRVGY